MKNFLYKGETIDVVAPSGGLIAGQFYKIGNIAGVVASTVAEGEITALSRCGVYLLPKTTGQAWTLGQPLYWNVLTSKCTNIQAAGDLPLGVAVPNADLSMAASADTFGGVLLGVMALTTICGQTTTATASDTVATGLSKVLSAVAGLEDAPVVGCDRATAVIGDQAGSPTAGSILVKTWMPTATGDATPIAATTVGKKVNWIAVGIGG